MVHRHKGNLTFRPAFIESSFHGLHDFSANVFSNVGTELVLSKVLKNLHNTQANMIRPIYLMNV